MRAAKVDVFYRLFLLIAAEIKSCASFLTTAILRQLRINACDKFIISLDLLYDGTLI
jgi:hypothetical protein